MKLSSLHLESGGIIITYRCSAKCQHCLHNASPSRMNEVISEENLARILEILVQHDCKSVHIEGGEPFLYPNALLQTISTIRSYNLNIEHIVTNGSWFKNASETFNILRFLKEQSVNRLLIKFGPFQNEFVSFRKIQKLTAVAEKVGISVLILGAEHLAEINSLEHAKTHTIKEYQKKFGDQFIQLVGKEFLLPLSARSFKIFDKFMVKSPMSEILKHSKDCKTELKAKHHFHIDLHANYIFPCTKGLTKPISLINESLNAEVFPVLSALYNGGIGELLNMAIAKYDYVPQPAYISKCHLCFHIREHLVNGCNINSPELQPIELYRH